MNRNQQKHIDGKNAYTGQNNGRPSLGALWNPTRIFTLMSRYPPKGSSSANRLRTCQSAALCKGGRGASNAGCRTRSRSKNFRVRLDDAALGSTSSFSIVMPSTRTLNVVQSSLARDSSPRIFGSSMRAFATNFCETWNQTRNLAREMQQQGGLDTRAFTN